MTVEKDVRSALVARLTGAVLASVLAAGALALGVFDPFGSDGDLSNLRHARGLAATEEPQRAIVVDSEDLPPKEYEDLGYGTAVVRLPDNSHADLWTLDTGPLALFFAPAEGERLTVVVDPDDPTWAADLGDAEASLLFRARYLALSSSCSFCRSSCS